MGFVGKTIRLALNIVPRTALQRVAEWAVPMVGLLYRGKGRECPICHSHYRRFMPYGYGTVREDALCPHCLSLERHRLLWHYLMHTHHDRLKELPTMLHIAPEVCLMREFRHMYASKPQNYITADLESPLADMHFDVQSIPMADSSVDIIICNHLLEHVESDHKALQEMYRIMRSGGMGVMLAPIDYSREMTYEDDTITDPKQRAELFGQYDHRRVYGKDYLTRLRAAGFEAEEIDYAAQFSVSERTLHSFGCDKLYIVRKG
ncbi:MAG: methyltransferase domain-containing protein [Alistipes sp.]|nr:methyltransferase domain-containing protein [Alistipes sp.]